MGATIGLESSDGAFNPIGYAELSSFQYIRLWPISWMTDSNMIGVSLWFKSGATMY
jgi:hypothetical protein